MAKIKKQTTIEILAEKLNKSITDIAYETDIPKITLYKLKQDRKMSPKLARKITSVYKDVNPDFLLGNDENIFVKDVDPNKPKPQLILKNFSTAGERVKAIRNKKEMSLTEFSEFLGVNRATLGSVEFGSSLPNLDLLIKLKKKKLIACMDEIVDGTNPSIESNPTIIEQKKTIDNLRETVDKLKNMNNIYIDNKSIGIDEYNKLLEKYNKLEEDYNFLKKMANKLI